MESYMLPRPPQENDILDLILLVSYLANFTIHFFDGPNHYDGFQIHLNTNTTITTIHTIKSAENKTHEITTNSNIQELATAKSNVIGMRFTFRKHKIEIKFNPNPVEDNIEAAWDSLMYETKIPESDFSQVRQFEVEGGEFIQMKYKRFDPNIIETRDISNDCYA